jgi:glycosyltransferase involved in cell wall biosynthesis
MLSGPFFSIIIPTYNREVFIEKTIRSVLDQSFTDYEVIVVDDGSTDNTKDIVSKIRDKRLFYFYKENGERGAARNYGIKKAKGGYITFLDSDDIYYPNYLSNAYESIKAKDQPEFLFLAYESIKPNGDKIAQFILADDDWKVLIPGNPMSCLGIVIGKNVFNSFIFNEDRELSGSEDWEFLIRVVANYGFKTDQRISAALIRHDMNSVFTMQTQKLVKRKMLSYQYAFKDTAVKNMYRSYKDKILAFMYSYISLHAFLVKNKTVGRKYLTKSIFTYPLIVFSKRTMVILKKMFL